MLKQNCQLLFLVFKYREFKQTRSKDELEPLKIVEAERRLQASTQSTVQYTIIQADQHIKQKNVRFTVV